MERRVIETSRLVLVPSTVDHAEPLWHAVEASLPELRPWMAWAIDDSYEHNRDFLTMCETMWQRDEAWTFTLFVDGSAAGTVGLGSYEPLISCAELGYWIRTDLAGRGLMTEAASAVVTFGFDEVGLHRLELHAGVKNINSNRVAEKLGFQRVGLLRDGSRGENGWYDCHVFDLLESDKRPLLPQPRNKSPQGQVGDDMAAEALHPDVRIGHVHLKVSDVERSEHWYRDVLGFELQTHYPGAAFMSAGGYHHHIGLNIWESRGGSAPPRGTTGLYHFAILYPTRAELARALKRVLDHDWPIDGASDHGVSEAIYLHDPDHNGIELYRDRDRSEWPHNPDGSLGMKTEPLDLQALLQDA